MAQYVKTRKDLPSGTVILNHAAKRNALSREVVGELQQALEDFQGERKVRGLIITGTGSDFCSGSDLDEISADIEDPQTWQQWNQDMQDLCGLLEFMLRFPKPIVAAVNGSVVGSGLALMLACDVVVAADNASFWLPEVQRGLVPGVTAPLLVFRAGASVAAHMLLCSQRMDATTMLRFGLVAESVAADLVWARAHEKVVQLAESAPTALQLTKQLINETIGEHLLMQLSIGSANTAAARSTEAAQRGVTAFQDKRRVDWND